MDIQTPTALLKAPCVLTLAETEKIIKEKEATTLKVLEQIRASGETYAERKTRIDAEKKLAEKKMARQKKVDQLRSKIISLRSQVMANRLDHSASGQLAQAKTQLYWLTHSMPYEDS